MNCRFTDRLQNANNGLDLNQNPEYGKVLD